MIAPNWRVEPTGLRLRAICVRRWARAAHALAVMGQETAGDVIRIVARQEGRPGSR